MKEDCRIDAPDKSRNDKSKDDKSPDELTDFWNRRADTFPRYSDSPNSFGSDMLELAKSLGVTFQDSSVLDIGAGSGQYTLKIAQMAKKVVALDLSDKMLAVSKVDAQALGLSNIEYVLSSWLDYPLPGPFDVVFASMCPALRSDEAINKLLESVGRSLVHIGFYDYVDPAPMAALINHYGVSKKKFNSGPEMRRWFDDHSLPCRHVQKSGRWVVDYDRDEAVSWCRTILADYGVDAPDEDLILTCLGPTWAEMEQKYVFDTPYFVEMLVWHK
ncbi:MAG: class I SAM-dependent methyltransferase [Deltaproteobacteria bacterium]|jgi:SAM-dependent methyltransferase|nr:class I SAM-dependent methyltransferase [Deltaproteobacteria bacterium]